MLRILNKKLGQIFNIKYSSTKIAELHTMQNRANKHTEAMKANRDRQT